ncbi:MAG: ABC transporter substrate-binding protein [Salinivirgaceae bacterium]|jgi:ABC-type transport system substrate-binding protein|nr:hypothetical protein [Bacteroidales bacterium]
MKIVYTKTIAYRRITFFSIVLLISSVILSCKNDYASVLGVISYSESDKPETIFPYLETKQSETQISSQIHSTLVTIDKETGEPYPAIAYDWMVNSDYSRFVFYLRDDVKFHEDEVFGKDKNRTVQAIDVVSSIKHYVWTCKKYNRPLGFVTSIQGIEVFYDACSDDVVPDIGIEGIIFSNEHTLVIELSESYPTLLYHLAMPKMAIMPHEALSKYGIETIVGCGPYKISKNLMKENKWILIQNENYVLDTSEHLGFSKIRIFFNKSIDKELQMLSEGRLSLIFGLSQNVVTQFMESNIERFRGENPDFILMQTEEMKNSDLYIIHDSNIKGISFDSFGIIRFNKTYINEQLN